MTDFQRQKMTNLFNILDADNSGTIQKNDFDIVASKIAGMMNLDANSDAYKNLFSSYATRWEKIAEFADSDNNGIVTLEEWLGYCTNMLSTPNGYEQHVAHVVNFVFDLFDADGGGGIPKDGLKMFYSAYGLNPEMAEETFAKLDLNGDGQITSDEMTTLCGQYHKSNDLSDPGNHFLGIIN